MQPEPSLTANPDNQTMVERSLVSTGNTYRMKKAIEKARSGQETTIAYLGGSITQGFNGGEENYAKLSFQSFADQYGTGDNVKYVNAGMAGTPSMLGLIRAERDVLQHEPDIVFVEFAVNDANDELNMTAYESLLRRILDSKKQPAVVLIFTVTDTGYSAQKEMESIGRHYDLPMISVKDAIMPEIEAGAMTWLDYSDDTVHPDVKGHALITEFVRHYYQVLESEEKDNKPVIPDTTVYGKVFENMVMLDATNTKAVTTGSFAEEATIQQFPSGWTHRADGGNDSFVLELTASSLFIVTKESNDASTGTIVILVDGEPKLSIDGYNTSGWNNPATKLVFQEEKAGKHRIEIRMGLGSETKEFSILAFGVAK